MPAVATHETSSPTLVRTMVAVVESAARGGGQAMVQQVLEAVQRAATAVIAEKTSKNLGGACLVRLSVAAVKRCSREPCTAADVTEMLRDPKGSFDLASDICEQASAGAFEQLEAGLLVMRAVDLVRGGSVADAKAQAKELLVVAGKLMRLAAQDAVKADAKLMAFIEISQSLLDDDYAAALAQVMRLLPKPKSATEKKEPRVKLRKLIHLLGAVASYTQVVHSTKDVEPEAARKARKQALETLIDGATDRHGREGDRIVSIGSNVGLSLSQRSNVSGFEPVVRVPLGVSLDHLPVAGEPTGVRIGAQLIDLGQFIRRDPDGTLAEVSWQDFVAPGVEVGYLFGSNINLSGHLSYAPSLLRAEGSEETGVWRFGVALSYYVPFFDLN